MNNYLINSNTLAILPTGNSHSLVIEKDQKFIVNKRPNYIIKSNCNMYGSSLKGRLDGTRVLTGYTYKAPILIEDKTCLVLFPTSSPRLENVAWINLENVTCAYRDNQKQANMLKFNNGISVKIDSSLNILNNQILRATRLASILSKNNG